MNKGSNVIDLKSRRRIQPSHETIADGQAPVFDMTERRQEMLTHERREVRRTILSEFIGGFIVVPNRGLQKVAIYDISETGVSFDLDLEVGKLAVGEEVAMRVYMNQQTYFGFVVHVSNARIIGEEGAARHGCGFVKGTINDVALHHFVKFIESVSASLQTDHGDVMVSNLGGR
jgi:hypothetical protein